MRERLQKSSLSLHPQKTRLIEFGHHAAANRKRCGLGKPKTFNFLKRRSRRGRMRRNLRRLQASCDGECISQSQSKGLG